MVSPLTYLEMINALQKFITTTLRAPERIRNQKVIKAGVLHPLSHVLMFFSISPTLIAPTIPPTKSIHGRSVMKNAFLEDFIAFLTKS